MGEMKNKEKKVPSKRSISELILSAIYFLQKKNGVSMKDITKYICSKRGYKQSQMKNKVKEALNRGTKNGIFNLKKGLYKVDMDCRKKLATLKKKLRKKSDVHKAPKKVSRKKISVEKVEAAALGEKKLTPINENSTNSLAFRDRMGSRTMSEDVFDRRARGNIYFEPSMLAKGSDEEYDDEEDDEEDNEDDLNSETDEGLKGDIFTFNFVDDLSQERLSEIAVCNPVKLNQKRASPRERKKPKCPKTERKKKASILRRITGREERRPKRFKCCEDCDVEGDKEDEEEEEEDNPEEEEIRGGEEEGEEETNHSAGSGVEDGKGNKIGGRGKVKRGEKKEKTQPGDVKRKSKKETKETKESKEQKEKRPNSNRKGGPEPGKRAKRRKRRKRQRFDEKFSKENQDSILKKEKRFLRSDCVVVSSTEFLPRGFKASVSPPLMAGDEKFCPASAKFESQDSLTRLLSDKVKKEPPEDKALGSDFKMFCECESPKRKNRSSSCGASSENDAEPVLKRIKSRRSEK